MTDMLAFETNNLTKKFGKHLVVNGINLKVQQGEIFSVLGPNGAGKTTLIRILATLLKQNSGIATIFGHDVNKDAAYVRSLIGLTGQYATVDEDLSGRENLILFAHLNGLKGAGAEKRAADLLEEFSLTEAANKSLNNFSGGMRRRLDLAISLISKPPLIFLDEPTTGLDPRTRLQLWDTIHRLNGAGTTILLTTQYLEEADQLADRIAVIDKGTIVASGTPDQLKKKVGSNSIVLTMKRPSDLLKTQKIIEDSLGETTKIDKEKLQITAPFRNMNNMAKLMAALSNENIKIDEFSIQKPTLDEVFLKVTAR
ncbi:ATP-binding cassette domain-containing protein [Oenococcus sp. UCMA 16435]|nr:ATP-binding cassette domain-containing protein [Oenococcus sp. UCMA 16435]